MLKLIVGVAGAAGWGTAALFMAATATHTLSTDEKALLSELAIASNYEVKAAEFAQQASNSESMQMAARAILIDQVRLAEQLRVAVAERDPGFRWPTGIDDRRRALLRQLQRASNLPAEFGRQMMIANVDCKFLYLRFIKADRAGSQMQTILTAAVPVAEEHVRLAEGLAAKSLGMR